MASSNKIIADVSALYRELLGREPDPTGLDYFAEIARECGLEPVRRGIEGSEEYRDRANSSLGNNFSGYSIEDVDLIRSFADTGATGQPGFVTDFIGTRVRTSSLWSAARRLDGTVTPPPIPDDGYRAEAAEWAGALKSVRSAQGQFVAMELGAGFGPWIVACGAAARRRGIRDIRLYAVEADPTHYAFLQQNLDDNGFREADHTLLRGAVGMAAGKALWPVIEDSREDWGTRPVTDSDYLGRTFGQWMDVEIFGIVDLVRREPRWDLLHIDVQGAEADICATAIDALNDRVHWIVIGTHSRSLDGRLIDLLWPAGWILENEKPAKFRFNAKAATLEAMTFADGVQVWRNPRFDAEAGIS